MGSARRAFRAALWLTACLLTLAAAPIEALASPGGSERRIDDVSTVPPQVRLALYNAQEARENRGDPREAVAILKEFIADHPDRDHFMLRFHLAVSYAQAGEFEPALEEYQHSVAMEPLFAQGWLNLGELAYNLGRFELAASALERGYEVSEWKEPAVRFYYAAALLMAERPADAVPVLKELISATPDEAKLEWHRALIMAYGKLGDEAGGRAAVDSMLSEHVNNADAWRLAFQYFGSIQDYEHAAVMLEVAGYLQPLSREEELELGDLLLSIGVPAQAAWHYETALADSASAPELERLASAHLGSYDLDGALAVLNRALAADPTPRLWSLLGDLHFMQGDYAASYDAYGECVDADSTAGRAYLMMGYCGMQLGRADDATAALERAGQFPDQADKASRLLGALKAAAKG